MRKHNLRDGMTCILADKRVAVVYPAIGTLLVNDGTWISLDSYEDRLTGKYDSKVTINEVWEPDRCLLIQPMDDMRTGKLRARCIWKRPGVEGKGSSNLSESMKRIKALTNNCVFCKGCKMSADGGVGCVGFIMHLHNLGTLTDFINEWEREEEENRVSTGHPGIYN